MVEADVGLDDGEANALQHLAGPLLSGVIPATGTGMVVFALVQ